MYIQVHVNKTFKNELSVVIMPEENFDFFYNMIIAKGLTSFKKGYRNKTEHKKRKVLGQNGFFLDRMHLNL